MEPGATGNTADGADTVETAPWAGAKPVNVGPAAPIMKEEVGEPQVLPADTTALAGDAVKSSIFIRSSLVNSTTLTILVSAVLIMPFAVYLGRLINEEIGERSYAALFWTVMAGYTARLIF